MLNHKNPFIPVVIVLFILIVSQFFYSFIANPKAHPNDKNQKGHITDTVPGTINFHDLLTVKVKPNTPTDYFAFDRTLIYGPANSEKIADTTKQNFLLIGDSMLEGLGLRMNDYCNANGYKMHQVIWYSSSTLWYGNCDTIRYFVEKYNPTYVVLVIGSMELFIRNIKENRKQFVQNILEQLGGRKYIWVGPPNWTDDTGINDLLSSSVDDGTFFLSKNLNFERSTDGVHPTSSSASRWMDSIATFMMKKCSHPVMMKYPVFKAKRNPPTVLLPPNPPESLL